MKSIKQIIVTLVFVFSGALLFAQEDVTSFEWPREIQKNEYTITLYQPQLETLEGNTLKGRFALSVKQGKKEPVFGASWFSVRLETDKTSRTAVLESIDITKIKFAEMDDTDHAKLL